MFKFVQSLTKTHLEKAMKTDKYKFVLLIYMLHDKLKQLEIWCKYKSLNSCSPEEHFWHVESLGLL